jgi:hypothetical protein
MERFSPEDEDDDGEAVAVGQHRRPPRMVVAPWPSYSLEMVLVWRSLSSSLEAAKGRQIRGYG